MKYSLIQNKFWHTKKKKTQSNKTSTSVKKGTRHTKPKLTQEIYKHDAKKNKKEWQNKNSDTKNNEMET